MTADPARKDPAGADLAGLALAVMAIAPEAAGGIWLRAQPGPDRDRWLAALRAHALPAVPFRRMPAGIAESRLIGGLDLAATLASGLPVTERGLLAEADGGYLVISMAERLDPWQASLVSATAETGELHVERDGVTQTLPAHFAMVALDEGIDDEAPPAILTERLGLVLDLAHAPFVEPLFTVDAVAGARARLSAVATSARIIGELCAAAAGFGLASLRPSLQAVGVARALAALHGRLDVADEDAILAAALVLAPRAVQWPSRQEQQEEAPPPPPQDADTPPPENPPEDQSGDPPDDVMSQSALAALPAGLLADLKARAASGRQRSAGKAGAREKNARRGRAVGVKPGDPRTGARLGLIDTLRAAAPWQKLRRGASFGDGTIAVRREDFRIVRRRARRRTTTLFIVDASGSSALQRLGEAKGAVQLLLAECYVRRDEVALITFRGRVAEMVLPPTRALARAARALAGLAGGGGTPLATAIDTARQVAEGIMRSGRTPVLVFMTDARANIGRDGQPGRERAMADARQSARELAALGQTTILIDTANKPGEAAAVLADAMEARYLPLPYAAPEMVVHAVSQERPAPRAAQRA
ncbi:MAG: magnesium chelatase subunit D [Beijerinckiaceae bacterium]|jgi:magnesium chelatase subunit D|nr:magnesium chelatase subunit D [Beijerinckiaceae bacterium]